MSEPDRKQWLFPWTLAAFALAVAGLDLLFLKQCAALRPVLSFIFAFAGDLLPVLILTAAALFCRSRIFAVLSVLTMVLTLTVRIVNSASFSALKAPLTYPVFRLLAEHTEHASLAAQFGSWYYIGLTAGVLIFLCVVLLWIVSALRFIQTFHEKILLVLMILLPFMLTAGALRIMIHSDSASAADYVASLIQDGYKDHLRATRPVRFGRFPDRISPHSLEMLREIGIIPDDGGFRKNEPLEFDRIVVIAVESLDLKFIHAYNPEVIPENATPFLDRMVKTYPSFTNCFTGAQPTSFAFDSMMLSRMDFDDDLRLQSISLADILHSKGIETAYIAPTNGDLFDNERDYTLLFRFDHAYFLSALSARFGVKQETRWGLTDATLFDCAAKLLLSNGTGKRAVTFISTMDLHNPYIGAKGPFRKPFFNALKTTDANLEKFVMRLMKNKQFFTEKTLIVLTADHTATHGANPTNRASFTPGRIPLILISKSPLKDLPETTGYFSQIDLPATLVSMLGLPIPETFMGQDIRTKKDFALSFNSLERTLDLHLPGEKTVRTILHPGKREDKLESALFEWYDSYYGIRE